MAVECSININGNEVTHNVNLNNRRKLCSSCTQHIILLVIAFLITIGIGSVYIHFYWHTTIKNCFNKLPN